jgi:hypothetical protein
VRRDQSRGLHRCDDREREPRPPFGRRDAGRRGKHDCTHGVGAPNPEAERDDAAHRVPDHWGREHVFAPSELRDRVGERVQGRRGG